MTRLAAVDAQLAWRAATVPNDQFLLYAFDGRPPVVEMAKQVRARAARCPDMQLRLVDDAWWRYPRWAPAAPADRVRVHDDDTWAACLTAVAGLGPLDLADEVWRAHLWQVARLPSSGRSGTVLVLQVAHALADGTRASALAAWLLGRDSVVSPVAPSRRPPSMLRAGLAAARAHRRLDADTAAGAVPLAGTVGPLRRTNVLAGTRSLRTLVVDRAALTGATVTVRVLAAVAAALAGSLGDDGERLLAEVPMAHVAEPGVRNAFRTVGVDLRPELPLPDRLTAIADQLADRRRRGAHPAFAADRAALAATPAALLRWGVGRASTAARPPAVSGHTVVSSVHRGPADLRLAGAPVVFSAGFPALSPVMGLTHGVHGLGGRVAVSIHACAAALPDIDAHLARLEAALGR